MSLKTWLLEKTVTGKLPLWIYRLMGKKVAKKLNLEEENNMADPVTDPKPWYQSKAKLAAIVTAIVACIQPVSTALGHPYQVPLWVIEFLMGLGIYGVRDAIKPPQA